MLKYVHVAVGVVDDGKGNILIAKRGGQQHLAGLWEFPGGKLERGETVSQALQRELHEELDIKPTSFKPLLQIRHNYPEKSVLLDVWRITQFEGQPQGNEGQPWAWVARQNLNNYAFPAANAPIVNAICLPDSVAISGSYSSTEDFHNKVESVFQSGIKLFYLRAPELYQDQELMQSILSLCTRYDAITVVNDVYTARSHPGFGLHLTQKSLLQQASSSMQLQGFPLVGASCHKKTDLKTAKILDLDYAFLSPVFKTPTHPKAQTLGAGQWGRLVNGVGIPTYALGGMEPEDVSWVRSIGGQGVAGISAFWPR